MQQLSDAIGSGIKGTSHTSLEDPDSRDAFWLPEFDCRYAGAAYRTAGDFERSSGDVKWREIGFMEHVALVVGLKYQRYAMSLHDSCRKMIQIHKAFVQVDRIFQDPDPHFIIKVSATFKNSRFHCKLRTRSSDLLNPDHVDHVDHV